MDSIYWIEGKVSIPEGRKEEFNENVQKLFRLCGIRKLEEIEVAGRRGRKRKRISERPAGKEAAGKRMSC